MNLLALFLVVANNCRLLEMYLDPKDGKEPMFKAAVRLLHNHGESLDPLQVLEVSSSTFLSMSSLSLSHTHARTDKHTCMQLSSQ